MLLQPIQDYFSICCGKNVLIALWEMIAADENGLTLIISTSLYSICAFMSFTTV